MAHGGKPQESSDQNSSWVVRWKMAVLLGIVLTIPACSGVVSDREIVKTSGAIVSDDDDWHYRSAASQKARAISLTDALPPNSPIDDAPRTIRRRTHNAPWNLSLVEAVHLAIRNNPVIRQNAQFLSPSNPLLNNPDQNPSVFDVALQQTGVLFGNRGTEAAMADFMPQVAGSLVFGRSLEVQNNLFLGGGLPPGTTLVEDNDQFRTRIDQPLQSGGTLSLIHNWDYLQSNQPGLLFPSTYTGSLGAELRQPLLAGAGKEYTDIAGPISLRGGVQSGVAQGIRIAQVNERIAAVDLELMIRQLALEVGEVYWQLFQAFREYEAFAEVRDASYKVWQQVAANEDALGGAVVAQAEQTYLQSRSQAESSLSMVYETETRLRRLLGLPLSDERLLTPNAIPLTTELGSDWSQLISEAYGCRVELQRQKLSIQSLDWQLLAARSLTKPRLDFVGGYQINGFGDDLIASSTSDGVTDDGYRSAYGSLLRAKQPAWNAGLQFSMPIGFRAEQAQVRHLELRLAKARAALATQEGEIRYELGATMQSLARWFTVLQTNDVRRQAVQRQVNALEAEYQAGRGDRSTIDLLLRARTSLAQAQSEYSRSLTGYNTALWDIEYRRGTILTNNRLYFDAVVAQKSTHMQNPQRQ